MSRRDAASNLPEADAAHAGRLILKESDGHTKRGEIFSFETTLAGFGHLKRIKK